MTKILVAALTFRRSDSLRSLLDAFTRLATPADTDVRFLIVDNDAAGSGRPVVDEFAVLLAHRLDYVVEPARGIAVARNRALRTATASDADFLCFVDDDAFPADDWLCALDACRRATDAVLVFGPVRFVPEWSPKAWRRFVGASVAARGRFLERHSKQRAREGRTVTSGTGNWMGDLRWIAAHSIEFDAARFPFGGEDAAFREAVRAVGGVLTFCPGALVHESLPTDRMSVRYQFQRGREHGRQTARLGRRPHLIFLRHPVGRILIGALLVAFPVLGLASFALGVHQLGMGVGELERGRVDTE